MGAFSEPGGVIFDSFFLNVFWTSPGATPDGQSGVPGLHSTDRGSKVEDNFGGLGRCGGVGGVLPNNQNLQPSRSNTPWPKGRRIVIVIIIIIIIII